MRLHDSWQPTCRFYIRNFGRWFALDSEPYPPPDFSEGKGKKHSRENPLLCDYQLNDDESEDEEVNFS